MSPRRKGKQGRRCRVVGCVNQKNNPGPGTHLFRVPNKNVPVLEAWVQLCGNPELLDVPISFLKTNLHICGAHFLPEEVNVGQKLTKLHKPCVPTLFAENHKPLSDEEMQKWRHAKHYGVLKEANSPKKEAFIDSSAKRIVQDGCNAGGIGNDVCPPDSASIEVLPIEQVKVGVNESGTEHHQVPDLPENRKLVFLPSTVGGVTTYEPCFCTPAEIVTSQSGGGGDNLNAKPVLTVPEPPSTHAANPTPRPASPSPDESEVLAQPLPDTTPTKEEPSSNFEIVKNKRRRSANGTGPFRRRIRPSVAKKRRSRRHMLEAMGAGDAIMTPVKKELLGVLMKVQVQLEELQKTNDHLKALTDLKNIDSLLEHVISPQLRLFVVSNIRNHGRVGRARRWTLDEKLNALAIFKRSPKGYRYLSYILCLPSVRTLQRLLQLLPMAPGINYDIIKHIADRMKNDDRKDKCVILMFDEMFITKRLFYNPVTRLVEGVYDVGKMKDENGEEYHDRQGELAGHALVFMVQGLCRRYKQPVGFHFTGSTVNKQVLADLIKEYIRTLEESGFHVVATVSDQGPTNVGALNILLKSTDGGKGFEEGYFKVVERKVWPLYDVPHLFKNLRNNFMKAKWIVWDGMKAYYSDIVRVYLSDKAVFRCTKLTREQLVPKRRKKMKVSYAVKTLSYTTSCFLSAVGQVATKGRLLAQRSYSKTGKVVRDLDRLFDVANGPSGPKDIKPRQRKNVSAKSFHFKVWKEMIEKLDDMEFWVWNDDTNRIELRRPASQDGFIHTLKNFRNLWDTLSSEYKFTRLNLRQLNQDPLENLFGVIRQHGATCDSPTVGHFVAALKTSIITNLTGAKSRGGNTMADNVSLLSNLKDLLTNSVPAVEEENESELDLVDLDLVNSILSEDSDSATNRLRQFFSDNDYDMGRNLSEEELEDEMTDLGKVLMLGKSHVAGYLNRKISAKLDCDTCKDSLSAVERTDEHAFTMEKEYDPDNPRQFYADTRFCKLVEEVENKVDTILVKGNKLHVTDILQRVKTVISLQDFSWLECSQPLHFQNLTKLITDNLATMLLRTICKRESAEIKSKLEEAKKAREAERCLSKEEKERKRCAAAAKRAALLQERERKKAAVAEIRRKRKEERDEERIHLKEMKRLEKMARREGISLDASVAPRTPTRAEIVLAKSSNVWTVSDFS